MNIHLLLLTLCLSVQHQTAFRKSPSNQCPTTQVSTVRLQGITKEQAIVIAQKDARRSYKSLGRFRVVACELSLFWRIIFDGGGPEYVVDKKSGLIRRRQTIKEDWPDKARTRSSGKDHNITRDEAIDIARIDAGSLPGIDIERFTISACELERVWRVFVEFKLFSESGGIEPVIPHSSAPNYVIDKKSGEILLKQR